MKGAMKAMKKSVIARGKGAKARVFSGKKAKTSSGLTKDKLMKNKAGKVVSKQRSAASKKNWVKNGLKAWSEAVKKARKELGLTGFVAIGGKSAAGKALYAMPSPCSDVLSCCVPRPWLPCPLRRAACASGQARPARVVITRHGLCSLLAFGSLYTHCAGPRRSGKKT